MGGLVSRGRGGRNSLVYESLSAEERMPWRGVSAKGLAAYAA